MARNFRQDCKLCWTESYTYGNWLLLLRKLFSRWCSNVWIVLAAALCRRGRGWVLAITSMRKVELELEFNFLFGSSFLSRLVRQVISVPFVVWINTAVAPRQFCLIKISLRGFYWSIFTSPARLAIKDCVSSKARTLWAMKGKKKMK